MNLIDWAKVSEILFTSVTTAVFTGILAFIIQKLIERKIERSLEEFKVELQSSASRNQVQFTRLYEKRAEILAELYKQLVDIDLILTQANNDVQWQEKAPDKKQIEKAKQGLNDVIFFFEKNRIFFLGKSLCEY